MTEAQIVEMTDQDLHESVQEERSKEIRRNQTAKARAVRAQKAQQRGYNINGRPPYGYRWEGETLTPYAPELEIVALAHQLHTNGFSYAKIADSLNALGYCNRAGKTFHRGSVYQLLHYKKKSTKALISKT